MKKSSGKCRQFADDILESIFSDKICWFLIQIALQYVPRARIDDNIALIQIMSRSHYLNSVTRPQ